MTEWIFSSSALILIVIALRGLLKDKLRPMVRYCLWGLVLVRLLLPFSLFESTLSLGNALSKLTHRTDSAVTQYETTYDQVVQQHIQTGTSATPAQLREETRQQVYEHTYTSIADRYAQQGIIVPEQQLQQEAQVQTQTIDLLVLATDLVPGVWYVGMALMTLAFLVSNGWFARKLHKTRIPMTVSDYPLPVFVTDYPATPCLFGLIRPKVYLTPESAQDDSLLRHVLAHELTHFRHGDHIWSALRGICLVLHWYNPLVWAAVLLSKKDAELACDEATIRTLGEDERIAYGRTLIGMTCVKRDPKSFLITATTMISGKHTLRERITAIARKPKNAILAVIACVLVLSIAAGCTFSGAPANPTEPTTALDAVYEKVQAAAQAINTQEVLHVKYYISPEMPLNETDLASRTTYNEVWISGEDLYEARHEQDIIIPQILHYHGSIYNHIRDNLWLPAVSSSRTPDDYRLHIPRRSECTMSWIETNGYLDVTFANNSGNNGSGTEIRLDADGNLVWYASYIHTTGSADAPGEGAVMYVIMTYENTNSQQIKAHLDTVAPQLIAGMEFSDPNVTEPVEPPVSYADVFPFIYQDDPGWDYWREYIGPNDCVDGYLYVQNRNTKEITLLVDTPVVSYSAMPKCLFCATQDGRILQVDYNGKNLQCLYEASGEISDIFAFYSTFLFFNDGADLIKLDLDTMTASVVGNFPNCESIYAVKDHWLSLRIDGKQYAYDTVTQELVRFRSYGEEALFSQGIWPVHTIPEGMVALPENCTLADVVSSYEENLSWKCGLGHTHDTPFSIPVIQPFSIAAVHCQDMIYAEWMPHLEYQRNQNTCPGYALVEYEAAVNGELLSIVIHVWWDSGNHEYRVYNFDLFTGAILSPDEMVRRYLDISYAEFLMAVSDYRMDRLQATQPNVDMRKAMAKYDPDLAEMDEAALYLDKDGNLCLYYVYMDIAGAREFPTVTPLPKDLEFSGTDAAYTWLFDMYESRIFDDESRLYNYWSILHKVYGADIDEFEDQSHKLDDALMQSIWSFMFSDIPEKK